MNTLSFQKIGINLRYLYIVALALLITQNSLAQTITGIVFEKKANQNLPVIGAIIRWKEAKTGTVTDIDGKFSIEKKAGNHELIVSSLGYKTLEMHVHSNKPLAIELLPDATVLDAVTIRSDASSIDRLNPIHTEILTTKALAKAACCNLSESFETNASVSVSYADAITGTKQIQMLGLSGVYIQTNTENIPSIRGLNSTFGLNYIPGTWVTSIDVAKGVGSVVNGYESMTGAINVELVKPDSPEKLYLNAYANSFGRGEINLNLNKVLNKKWSVGLLSHGSTLQNKIDFNNDGFKDLPTYTQWNGVNRWKYQTEKYMVQFGVKALTENRLGGQVDFDPNTDKGKGIKYGFGSKTNRYEFFSKTAKLFPNTPYRGLGLIINALYHNNDSYFGLRNYTGQQKSLYGNLIYQDIFGNTNHSYKIGASYLYDDYSEHYTNVHLARAESVPGVFAEYTEAIPEVITFVVGSRLDFHNLYGTRFTPRLHVITHLREGSHLRLSAGKGWRMPNALAENFSLLVNSRTLVLTEVLRPEESWNYGISLAHDFLVGNNKGSLIIDGYRTNFQNQLVTDMESAGFIQFYNLRGESYSNSAQIELNYSPAKRLDIKAAYRWFDVRNDVRTLTGELTLLPKMFVNKDRVLVNAAYATKFDKWKFDLTWQWNGKRRIPDTSVNHIHSELAPPVFAPAFANINAQVTHGFKYWEAYLGGENLGNFTQKNPILDAQNPFGKNFDASMVWGPITGRMVYVGMRYKVK